MAEYSRFIGEKTNTSTLFGMNATKLISNKSSHCKARDKPVRQYYGAQLIVLRLIVTSLLDSLVVLKPQHVAQNESQRSTRE